MTDLIQHVYLAALFGFSGLLFHESAEANGLTFRNCGGVYTEPKGVISTPSFPGPYPTPISCEWLIQAPHGKKIIIYFTQFYMKDSFYITEYEYYQDKSTYIGRHSLGRISWEHALTSLAAYKPYVLIEFEVESIGNRHLRVIDHLLEVYGFNITYEILDKSTDVTKQTCSVNECSFLGNCLVSADFQAYTCNCFDKFFGENCQYGPYCDPDNGINQCTNGGRCKYFFGSLINQCECPPGFAGPYCEISEIPESANGHSAACKKLQCKHQCDMDAEGNAYCMCYDGYKMHQDNGTCIPIARYRMDVSLDLEPVPPMDEATLKQKLDEAKPIILQTIEENGVSTVTKFGIKRIRRRPSSAVLEFFFYCKVSEIKLVRPALQALIDQGQVGTFEIQPQTPLYEESPELMIAEVSNYNLSPAIRGELLTLVCAAKGSRYITFQWYKDNFKVDTALTLRNTWISTIPDTVHGMQLSVLNIDNVGPLDKGVFSCEVQDFEETQRGSIDVTVDNYPRVELSPMSLSVIKGEMVSIKCMSPDISWEKIAYEWFKNGVKIDSKGQAEYAEDMNPAGVRLVVPAVVEDAEYTCKVTNKAGSANVSAYVSAISANETDLLCQHTFEGQIHWQNTSGGHFYIERCPTEQGGYAQRNCICDRVTSECEWAQPNFAKCQSLDLIKVFDELQLLRSGYQQTTLKSVFDKLFLFTFPRKNVLIFSGDMDMVAHILKDFMVHLKNFPQLVNKDQPLSAQKVFQLLSGIIQQSSLATPDEKTQILVGPCIVQTLSTLFGGALKSLEYAPKSTISTLNVHMNIKLANLVFADEEESALTSPKPNDLIRYKRDLPVMQEEILIVISRHLSDLLSYRHRFNSKNKQFYSEIVSQVYSSAFYTDNSEAIEIPRVELTIDHDKPIITGTQNKTVCLSWIYDPSNMHSGIWTNTSCTVIASTQLKTVCNCKLPGHFVVAMVTSNYTEPESFSTTDQRIHVPLIIGYLLCLFLLIVTTVIFVKACGKLADNIYTVNFSFVWCLIAATITSILCLFNLSDQEAMRGSLQMCLAFFYLSAEIHLVLEVFLTFMKVYSITTIQVDKLRLLLICWGVPAIILIPIVVLSKTADHSITCNLLCWFSTDMKHFYVYIVSTIFFILVFLVFIVSSSVALRQWKEECRYADRVRYLKQMVKSSIIFILLIVSTVTSLNLKNSSQSAQMALHLVFHICLCISVLVCRCIFDKHIRFMFERVCVKWERTPDPNSKKSGSSFRAFVKPEKVSNVLTLSQEEYNVSKYYDEVNRTKYTTERKRQLSLLLGSSVGGESGYASTDTKSASASVNNSNNSSKESALSPVTALSDDRSSENGGNDSGIYDFQDAVNNVANDGGELEPVNHSRNMSSGTKSKFDARHRGSPNRVKLLEHRGGANVDRSAGLSPVYYSCNREQNHDSLTRDKVTGNPDRINSKDKQTKSMEPYDLDQVIYYPCDKKKPSKQKSSSENAQVSLNQSEPMTQDGPSEVAALIHAPQEQDTTDESDMTTTSQLLSRV